MGEQQYKEEYASAHECKIVEWNKVSNVDQMWDQVKQVVIDSEREVCGSVSMERENPKSDCWNVVV